MDKKITKKLAILNSKVQKLEFRLAGARKQCDDPAEVRSLEQDVTAAKAALDQFKAEAGLH